MSSPLSLHFGDVLSAQADALVVAIDGTITPSVEQLDRILGNLGRQFVRRYPSVDLMTELEAQLDLPLPLGRATTIELANAPFRAVILVSSLHHVDHLDGTAKRALVRTCMRSAIEAAARGGFASLATAILQGGWRLTPDVAFGPMVDALTASRNPMTVDIFCIEESVFRTLGPMARSLGVTIVTAEAG